MAKIPNMIFISDLHLPYQHPDALEFIAAVKDTYQVKIAKSVGDIVDNHFPSFHDIEYGCLSAKEEFNAAGILCRELASIFPYIDVSLGNHDIMAHRKAKVAGIPEECLTDYNARYGVKWNWKPKHYFKVDRYNNCLMTHTISINTLTNARNYSHCSIQGHHHGTFGLEYFSDHETLRWSMTTGCLIDDNSPAFNYNKANILKRPILGLGVLFEEIPVMVPMRLKRNGRWDGST